MDIKNSRDEYSWAGLLYYFLKLGSTILGGSLVLVQHLQKDLVLKRRWISDQDYQKGLALSLTAPGPVAPQLVVFIGTTKRGTWGGLLCGLVFLLPSFCLSLVLGLLYRHFENTAFLRSILYGMGGTVIGILAKSTFDLSRPVFLMRLLYRILFLMVAALTALTGQVSIWLFLLNGFIAWLVFAPSKSPSGVPKALGQPWAGVFLTPLLTPSLPALFLFFAKASLLVFGSGLVILPFLHGEMVRDQGWLTDRQFLDSVAVGLVTPGPFLMVVGFMGFLIRGWQGALAAFGGLFLPAYLLVLLLAPLFKDRSSNPGLDAFVKGITAAALGAVAGMVLWLGLQNLTDIPNLLLAAGALAILSLSKIPEAWVILAGALLGLLIRSTA